MTRRDFLFKWLIYSVFLLPIWFLETAVLSRIPVFGVTPLLLPTAAVVVGVLEAGNASAGFGLLVGLLCDAIYPGMPGGFTLGLTVAGTLVGNAVRHGLRPNLAGCAICDGVLLAGIASSNMIYLAVTDSAPFGALLQVAIPEILWSLVFLPPIYMLYYRLYERIGGVRLM